MIYTIRVLTYAFDRYDTHCYNEALGYVTPNVISCGRRDAVL
jgi:hypothetical protein